MVKKVTVAFAESVIILYALILCLLVFTGGFDVELGALAVKVHDFKNPLILLIGALLVRKGAAGSFFQEWVVVSTLQCFADRVVRQAVASRPFRTAVLSALGVLGLLTVFTALNAPLQRGLIVSYYNNPAWADPPMMTTIDNTLEHRAIKPYEPSRSTNYSIRWTGVIFIPTAGAYEFSTTSDDGSELYLDQQLVVDNRGFHGVQQRQGVVQLAQGFHALTIRYMQGGGGAEFSAAWTRPGRKPQMLAQAPLFVAGANARAFRLYQVRSVALPLFILLWMAVGGIAFMGVASQFPQAWIVRYMRAHWRDGGVLLLTGLASAFFYGHYISAQSGASTPRWDELLLILLYALVGTRILLVAAFALKQTNSFSFLRIRIPYRTLEKYTALFTILYLSIPIGIFFMGWMKYSIGIPSTILLCCAVFSSIKMMWHSSASRTSSCHESLSLPSIVLGIGIILAIVSVSGSGGWGYQDGDWLRHTATLHDLIAQPWPVIYPQPEGPVMLVSYIAYYLPAACIGKLWGWQSANHVIFLTTLTAVILSFLWVAILTRAHPLLCLIIFLGFSGMDIVGNILFNDSRGRYYLILDGWPKAYEHIVRYSSNMSLIFWAPHQGPPGWLLTALFIFSVRINRFPRFCLFVGALSCLWTPFVSVGLTPLFIGVALCGYRGHRYTVRDFASWENGIGLVIGSALGGYFSTRFVPYPLAQALTQLPQGDFQLNLFRPWFPLPYLLFILLEFLILHGLLYVALRQKSTTLTWYEKISWGVSVGTLCVLPLLSYGYWNDLVMRVSIPALFITMLITILTIQQLQNRLPRKWLLFTITYILVLGSCTASVEIYRHLDGIYERHALIEIPRFEEVQTLFELQQSWMGMPWRYNFVGQFLGSADCWFTTAIMKTNPNPLFFLKKEVDRIQPLPNRSNRNVSKINQSPE